jgi:hypothetical protein
MLRYDVIKERKDLLSADRAVALFPLRVISHRANCRIIKCDNLRKEWYLNCGLVGCNVTLLLFLEVVSCAQHTNVISAGNGVTRPVYHFSDCPQPSAKFIILFFTVTITNRRTVV